MHALEAIERRLYLKIDKAYLETREEARKFDENSYKGKAFAMTMESLIHARNRISCLGNKEMEELEKMSDLVNR